MRFHLVNFEGNHFFLYINLEHIRSLLFETTKHSINWKSLSLRYHSEYKTPFNMKLNKSNICQLEILKRISRQDSKYILMFSIYIYIYIHTH